MSLSLLFPETEDPNAVLCLFKTENECVMKFTDSEHANGQSVLTALEEPGEWLAAWEVIPTAHNAIRISLNRRDSAVTERWSCVLSSQNVAPRPTP